MKLVFPTKEHEAQAKEFYAEFVACSSKTAGTGSLNHYLKESTYDAWLEERVLGRLDVANLPPDKVPELTYFCVREEDERIIGMINIRPTANELLRTEGGHIGYCVRPSERRKGYGTQLLRLGLEVCRRMDVHQVIVSCDKRNLASAGVIQNCGGVLDAEFYSKTFDETLQRYVISV